MRPSSGKRKWLLPTPPENLGISVSGHGRGALLKHSDAFLGGCKASDSLLSTLLAVHGWETSLGGFRAAWRGARLGCDGHCRCCGLALACGCSDFSSMSPSPPLVALSRAISRPGWFAKAGVGYSSRSDWGDGRR